MTDNAENRARADLVERVAPGLAYLRSRTAVYEFHHVDLEVARRLFLERASGLREDGQLSVYFGTLEEGQAPSLERLNQLEATVVEVIQEILNNPDRFGLTVVDEDREFVS